jgi:hypothetical protein
MIMRKLFFTFTMIALTVAYSSVSAQENKSEIRMGVGFLSTYESGHAFFKSILPDIMEKMNYSGAYSLGYKYTISRSISLGVTFGYSSMRKNVTADKPDIDINNFFTLAPEADIFYFQSKGVALYGSAGFGAMLRREKASLGGQISIANTFHPDIQISPLGIKVKFNKNFGAFAEAGYGYKGIISAGLFGRF